MISTSSDVLRPLVSADVLDQVQKVLGNLVDSQAAAPP